MNRQEFKKEYSKVRRIKHEFEVKLNTGNYPCGHDDMLCENFAANEENYLKDKPAIKYALANSWELNYLEARAYDLKESKRWHFDSVGIWKQTIKESMLLRAA